MTILDRVFPPSECDDAVGDRWAKSGTTLLGLWLIGGGVSSVYDEGEVA